MDDRGGEPILQWFPICKCHLPATGCQYCCTLFGGFQFQATFLIRNHSNVHCVEVDSKAALKDDKTFDVYHLDTIQVHNVQKPFKWTLCGSRFEGSFKLKSQPPDLFRDKLTPW